MMNCYAINTPLAFVANPFHCYRQNHQNIQQQQAIADSPIRRSSSKRHRHRHDVSPLCQFTTSSSEFDKDYSKYNENENDDDDANARSQFGTKLYWDAMYEGMGDFDANEYSWYYGFEVIKPYLLDYVTPYADILIPGCGNDPLLLDLYNAGYQSLTAFDYSEGAIERQRALLEYLPAGSNTNNNIELRVEDARSLPKEWEESYDVIVEKGALDAIYLSGDGNFEASVQEFLRCLKVGGVCMSFSGVVPEEVRQKGFNKSDWEWLRDGSDDLKAGCFVFRKKDKR
jgi:SAM-dependent methyltransferase